MAINRQLELIVSASKTLGLIEDTFFLRLDLVNNAIYRISRQVSMDNVALTRPIFKPAFTNESTGLPTIDTFIE
ncbi:hypothetical protein MNBD_GAMMA13-100 [hydrothermal vent metagenome]|uniref:Uncharacterized protein n=1 Tax=hydrothermal vent metagenome TaxID=652676 RepID=A0A3B0Y1C0_9ZZZZ